MRERGIPYVAVDEAKRALFANARLKSFDFVVYSKNGPNLLIDVKGRSRRNRSDRAGYETWATEHDVNDLMEWEQVFGEGFKAVLMFVYWIDQPLSVNADAFQHRDKWYLIMGIDLAEYRCTCGGDLPSGKRSVCRCGNFARLPARWRHGYDVQHAAKIRSFGRSADGGACATFRDGGRRSAQKL